MSILGVFYTRLVKLCESKIDSRRVGLRKCSVLELDNLFSLLIYLLLIRGGGYTLKLIGSFSPSTDSNDSSTWTKSRSFLLESNVWDTILWIAWSFALKVRAEVLGSSCLSWNAKVKVEPTPILDLNLIYPLNYDTIWSAMTRPSPMPYVFICWESYTKPNNLKSFFWSWSLIPMPVSSTAISNKCWSSCSSLCTIRT